VKNLEKKLSLLLLFCILVLSACSSKPQNTAITNNKVVKMEKEKNIDLNIMTTDKLLYGMVKSIVRDRHSVEYMFKDRNTELNFQFTDDSLNNIAKQDLFIFTGAGFEPWMNDFINKLNKNRVGVINVSRGIKLLSYNKVVKYKDTILRENPYYLLNPDNYKIALMNIKNSIQDKDPKNRDIYETNFSKALKNLDVYQKDLKSVTDKLGDCNFIVIEDELSYFVKYNNLNVLDLGGDKNTIQIMPSDSSAKEAAEAKLKNSKNLVLLYSNNEVLKDNAAVIKKYNIKTVNIKLCNGDVGYEELLKSNIESLKSICPADPVSK
jgi:ABC-type Zn uptake system ZnuABC Zn-binding protein ZnuA